MFRRLTGVLLLRHWIAAAAGIAITFPAVSGATTAQTTIVVSARVVSTCVVASGPLFFGNYDPTSSTPTFGSTTVSVTCTKATPYNVSIDQGIGSGASIATRKMTYNAATLDYGLYQDPGHSAVWGNTAGKNTVGATSTGLPASYTVYGEIPAKQAVDAGTYTDAVTVTVTY